MNTQEKATAPVFPFRRDTIGAEPPKWVKGYTAHKITDAQMGKHAESIPVQIVSARGSWALWRNKHNPELMNVTDSGGKQSAVHGYSWFVEFEGRVYAAENTHSRGMSVLANVSFEIGPQDERSLKHW